MKIWNKGYSLDKKIEKFTIDKDQTLDLYLAEFDLIASIAHARMLHRVGILNKKELQQLEMALHKLLHQAREGKFKIEKSSEDVHSQVEKNLIKQLGDVGKKIHTARSRNDQVFVAILLFSKSQIKDVQRLISQLFKQLILQAKKHEKVLMPGYTHTQIAMPSSFGLWFSAYAELLAFDMEILAGAYTAINHNPLGSAAGYGTSFPLKRKQTSKELRFADLIYSSAAAQMLRGKAEWSITNALGSIALSINKLATDICFFNSQNLGFIKLPKEFTTGSSIMPHKQNPDVFELIRAKTNKIIARQNELAIMISNLISGYHRDFQLTKETYITAWKDLLETLDILNHAIGGISVNKHILDNSLYDSIFTVENITKLVRQGTPFRDAYVQVAQEVNNESFSPNKKITHTHEGSISNLCINEIKRKFKIASSKVR